MKFILCVANYVFLFCLTVSLASDEPKVHKNIVNSVKAAIEKKHPLPSVSQVVIREISADNLKSTLYNQKYSLMHSSTNINLGSGKYIIRYDTWNKKLGGHADEIRMIIITGANSIDDARYGLFNIMGMATTMMITPETFDTFENSPGDICFTFSGNIDRQGADIHIRHKIWFSRDNISIELACSGDTDLLPIAKAIDQAIQSRPVKESAK